MLEKLEGVSKNQQTEMDLTIKEIHILSTAYKCKLIIVI